MYRCFYIQVAETCQLALGRLAWLAGAERREEGAEPAVSYTSVDPAPPVLHCTDTARLRATLLDENLDLFSRYRAMFSLRNRGDTEAVEALAEGGKNSYFN